MILSFKDRETEKLWNQYRSVKLPYEIQVTALRKLIMIHRAKDLNDLRVPPSNRLEKLKGGIAGQYSIRINDRWRVCFNCKESNACNVEIVDYHK